MKEAHGSLESEILNAVWRFEENNCNSSISVNDVYNFLNAGTTPRAYTTIKTVMDRLVQKKLLSRNKVSKKFCYNSTETRSEASKKAIGKLLKQYFHGDAVSLIKILEKECLELVK